MGKYAILIGQNVYTVFEEKVYKGEIVDTCYISRKRLLIVKWGKPLEGIIPKKESASSISQKYSTREIGEKIWFRLDDVTTV